MAKTRAGWERKLYRGTAGSTASTQVTPNATDIDYNVGQTRTGTTSRGDGSAIPKEHEQVVGVNMSLTFSMNYDDGDTHMVAILAAARAGTALAFKVEEVVSGSYAVIVDADFTIAFDSPGPLAGGMVVAFTCTPTKESTRDFAFA